MPISDPPVRSLPHATAATPPDLAAARRRAARDKKRRQRAAEAPEQAEARRLRDRDAHRAARAARPPRRFVAVDGEGVTGPDGVHRYVLLCASDQDGPVCPPLVNPDGLDYDDCLGFLCRLPRDAIVVGYGLGYDRTRWLHGIPPGRVASLTPAQGPGKLLYDDWWLGLTGSLLTVKPVRMRRHDYPHRLSRPRAGGPSRAKGVAVWDALGFFQTRFVDAIAEWGIGSAEEADLIAAGKGLRTGFRPDDLPAMTAYCQAECRTLAALMERLRAAATAAGVPISTWYGAGSLAGQLMRQNRVRDHYADPPDALAEPLARSFAGGRIESNRIGPVDGPVRVYDQRSAYPAALASMPSLAGARWVQRRKKWTPGDGFGLVHAEWSIDASAPWGPFPMRLPSGGVIYPAFGRSWVWTDELRAGLRLFPAGIRPGVWWELVTTSDAEPFGFLRDVYRQRLEWGAEGPGMVLKLAANAVGGKLGQRVGTAPYQQAVYASLMHARTRARLLEAVALDPGAVVQLAVDGLYCERPLPLPLGTGLGEWGERVVAGGIFQVRAGIHFPLDPAERSLEALRGRGVSRTVLHDHADRILASFDPRRPVSGPGRQEYALHVDRFHGLKTAAHLKDGTQLGQWRRWPFVLSYEPLTKRLPNWDGDPLRPTTWTGGAVYAAYTPVGLVPESCPYDPVLTDAEAVALQRAAIMAGDQPDGQLSEGAHRAA